MMEVDESNFEKEVLKSDKPVIVDFWAPWCMPCNILAPVFEKVSEEYNGKIKFAKLNTDKSPNIAMKYGVFSIPTMLFFHNGVVIDALIGAVPENILRKKIEDFLEKVA